ncbi:MAG: hypothetical protein IT323_16935 [Anaerolineae bacterium]|nr:hypothetical protein [Anaerolineae bacterium]
MNGLLHIYLLLDTSASMTGAPLEALKQGVNLLRNTLIARAARPSVVHAIAYESTPHALSSEPLTPGDLSLPALEPGGASNLGRALRLLGEQMAPEDNGLLYIFTDGEPTDDWEAALVSIRARVERVYAVLCGPAASEMPFAGRVDRAYRMGDFSPERALDTLRAGE